MYSYIFYNLKNITTTILSSFRYSPLRVRSTVPREERWHLHGITATPPDLRRQSGVPEHFDFHYCKRKGKVINRHLKNVSYPSTQFHGLPSYASDTGQEIMGQLVWRRMGRVGPNIIPSLHWFIQQCNKERTAVTGAPWQQCRNVQSRKGQGLCPQSICPWKS